MVGVFTFLCFVSCPAFGLGYIATFDFEEHRSALTLPHGALQGANGTTGAENATEGVAEGGLAQPGSGQPRHSMCDELEKALPFLPKEVERKTADDEQACIAPVKEESCVSKHPLWSCSFRSGHCQCRWSSACHGVMATLEAADDAHLICRPFLEEEANASRAGLCRCSGFKACPGKSKDWSCLLAHAVPANESKDLLPGVQERNATGGGGKANATQAAPTSMDLCSCRSQGMPVLLRLSPGELDSLEDDPLSEVIALHSNKPKTGISGKTINSKIHQLSPDDKERIVLTVSDRKKGEKEEQAEENPERPTVEAVQKTEEQSSEEDAHDTDKAASETAKNEELIEQCVITDGRPEMEMSHVLVLALMVAPPLVVLVAIAMMRMGITSSCCPSLAARPHRRGGDGPPGSSMDLALPTARDPRTLEAPADTEQTQLDERKPPQNLLYCLMLLMVLLKINVTAVLSTAHLLVGQSGQGASMDQHEHDSSPVAAHEAAADGALGGVDSGLLIAAAPFGGMFGILLAERTRMRCCKEVFLASCLCVLLGNLGCILAIHFGSFPLMLFTRAFAGLGEGTGFIGQTLLMKLSSFKMRTKVMSSWELGIAAGLVLGPALASSARFVFPGDSRMAVQGGVWITVVLAAVMLGVLRAFVPESEELCTLIGVDLDERPAWRTDLEMDEEKWAALFVTCSGSTVRLLGRLVWESSAILVLTAHYCLGYANAGYVAPYVVLFYLCAQATFLRICSWINDHNLVRCCELMELCGLLLMARQPRSVERTFQEDIAKRGSAIAGIVLFLLGSALFYSGNCLTSAPLNSWGTKRGPREVCVLFYQNLAVQLGVCAGASLSRVFVSANPHQNTLVVVLLPAVVVQVLLSEVALGAREPEGKNEGAAQACSEASEGRM